MENTYKRLILLLPVLALIIAFGCFWITQARFLGFAAYIIAAGGGKSLQSVVVSCKACLDSDLDASSGARSQCVRNAVMFLLKAGAAAVAAEYGDGAIREGVRRLLPWVRGA